MRIEKKVWDRRCYLILESRQHVCQKGTVDNVAAVTHPIQHTFQSKCSWEIGKERPIFIDHGAIVRSPAASEVCRLTINVLRHAALSRTFSVNEWAAIKYGELKSGNCHLDIRRIMHAQTELIVHVPFSCHSIFLANYRFFKIFMFSFWLQALHKKQPLQINSQPNVASQQNTLRDIQTETTLQTYPCHHHHYHLNHNH